MVEYCPNCLTLLGYVLDDSDSWKCHNCGYVLTSVNTTTKIWNELGEVNGRCK